MAVFHGLLDGNPACVRLTGIQQFQGLQHGSGILGKSCAIGQRSLSSFYGRLVLIGRLYRMESLHLRQQCHHLIPGFQHIAFCLCNLHDTAVLGLQVAVDIVTYRVNAHAVFVHIAHAVSIASAIIDICQTPAQLTDGTPLRHALDGLIILSDVEILGDCPDSSSCSIVLRHQFGRCSTVKAVCRLTFEQHDILLVNRIPHNVGIDNVISWRKVHARFGEYVELFVNLLVEYIMLVTLHTYAIIEYVCLCGRVVDYLRGPSRCHQVGCHGTS